MAVYTDRNPLGKYFTATVTDIDRKYRLCLFARLRGGDISHGFGLCRIPQHPESPAYQSRWSAIQREVTNGKSVTVAEQPVRCVGMDDGRICDLVQGLNGTYVPYEGVKTEFWLPGVGKIDLGEDKKLTAGDVVKGVYLCHDGVYRDLMVRPPGRGMIFARNTSSLVAGLYDIVIVSERPDGNTLIAEIRE